MPPPKKSNKSSSVTELLDVKTEEIEQLKPSVGFTAPPTATLTHRQVLMAESFRYALSPIHNIMYSSKDVERNKASIHEIMKMAIALSFECGKVYDEHFSNKQLEDETNKE